MAELGPMSPYKYDSDDGNEYTIAVHDNLSVPGSLPTGLGANGFYPRRWKPRVIHVERVSGANKKRKNLIATSIAFTGTAFGATITIDSLAYTVTGFTGEKRPGLLT
jgi:hypothetical protein